MIKKQDLLNKIGILFLGEAEYKNFGDYYEDVPVSNNDGNVVTIGDVYKFIVELQNEQEAVQP